MSDRDEGARVGADVEATHSSFERCEMGAGVAERTPPSRT
jgi:hypothetical protein